MPVWPCVLSKISDVKNGNRLTISSRPYSCSTSRFVQWRYGAVSKRKQRAAGRISKSCRPHENLCVITKI